MPGMIYLVGAGPGHPGLLTLRAVECLRRADLVIYDKLVPTALLSLAPPAAEKVCVTDLGSTHPARVEPVHHKMLEAAHAGKTVVRLKGGDPHVFGRGGEEAEVIHAAGLPFEVVPGITAALGMASYAGIPLTHRQHASAVALVTGHEDPTKPETMLDWHALTRFPGTLVIYMGVARLEKITGSLLQAGKSPDTLAAVVQHAATGKQRTVTATLATLASAVRLAGITAPALTIVGSVVGLRDQLNWFERRSLFGQRVLVTRPRPQAEGFVEMLLERGAVPIVAPIVEIQPLQDYSAVDRAIEKLSAYQWLVFTSVNGVEAFFARLRHLGKDLRALGSVRIAAIGPKTAEAIRGFYLLPDLVPEVYQSEYLADTLRQAITPGAKVLLARADRGRDVLREVLSSVAQVDQVPVYSQVDSAELADEVLQSLRRGEIGYVIVTSSNIAKGLLRQFDETCKARVARNEIRLVSISSITSEEIRRLGFEVAGEAKKATMEALIEEIERLVRMGTRRD